MERRGKLIDEEVRKLIGESYEIAKEILMRNKEGLTRLAELLLKKEIVYKADSLAMSLLDYRFLFFCENLQKYPGPSFDSLQKHWYRKMLTKV